MYIENEENVSLNLRDRLGSGIKENGKPEDNILLCAKFQESLHLNFGSVRVKEAKSLHFILKNPSISKPVQISIDSTNEKHGLQVLLQNSACDSVLIPPLESRTASVQWTPTSDSMLREIIKFKMDDKGALQVIVQGLAGKGMIPVPIKRQSMESATLKLVKKKESSRQSLALVSAAKPTASASTDDQWADKQVTSFVDWMNYKYAESQISSASAIAATIDGTSDLSVMSELTKKQKEARLKQHASLMYKLSEFNDVRKSIETEVQQQKLQLREDREILQDLGLQEAFFGILFSYEMAWLSLGLEIVCEKPMKQHLYDNSAKSRNHAKSFVMENMFNNATIASKFPAQSGLYLSQEKKLKNLLRKNLLEKFLTLVLFLDRGRVNNLTPLKSLFVKESIYKSSKDVIVSFCRCFLHGEGDIVKHLGLIGYSVHFNQSHVDEINCEVTNMAVDLRDGVRLSLLMDILTKSTTASSQLRVPAVSRLQKLHNVGVVLRQIFPEGTSMVDAKSIVDGNRDKTLFLLWNIMYTFELRTILSADRINAEVQSISNSIKVSVCNNDIAGSLVSWCNAVAEPLGVKVTNLNSLSDGKVLCMLIRYYLPSFMPDETEIQLKETSTKHIGEQRRNFISVLKACRNIGGIPPLLYEMERGGDEKTMIIFLGHLFVRLTESSLQVKASTKLQRFFRVNRSKFSKADGSGKMKRRVVPFPEHTLVWKENTTATISELPNDDEGGYDRVEYAPPESIAKESLEEKQEIEDLLVAKGVIISEISQHLDAEKLLLNDMVEQLSYPMKEEIEQVFNSSEREGDTVMLSNSEIDEICRPVPVVDEAALVTLHMTEASLRFESEARQALEVRVKNEVEARMILEEKLRQIELKNAMLIETMQTKELTIRLAEFVRRRSVRLIEHTWSTYLSRRTQLRILKGVVKLQAVFRGAFAQRKYLCLVLAVQILQSSWRRKRCAHMLASMSKKACVIQIAWREYHNHLTKWRQQKSAIRLASWWRSLKLTRRFAVLKCAATRVQSLIRMRTSMKKLALSKISVLKIQSLFKRALSRSHGEKRKVALGMLSRSISAFVARKRMYTAFQKQKLAKEQRCLLQANSRLKILYFLKSIVVKKRRAASVAVISKWFVAMLPLVRVRRMLKGFSRLTAVYHARLVRSRSSAAVTFCLNRVREAEVQCRFQPGLRLSELTKNAVLNLNTSTAISDMLKSCQVLEMATEYSIECCHLFVQARKFDVLLGLLRSCNRSEAHQELLRTVLVILLHVARVERFAAIVGESIEVTDCLVDLLQMFRDKKYLFKLACELLIRFVKASSTVKDNCMSLVVFKRLEGIHHIMERKDRLESRVRSIDARSTSKAYYPPNNCKSIEISEPIHYIQHLMTLLK